jgi:hypothetical protein
MQARPRHTSAFLASALDAAQGPASPSFGRVIVTV